MPNLAKLQLNLEHKDWENGRWPPLALDVSPVLTAAVLAMHVL
jgi:hypothetical protein